MKLETSTSRICAIALGSNLGDRLANLQAARDLLRGLADPARPFLQAPVYRSAPVGCPPGAPEFLNTVVAFHWAGDARRLLAATQRVEAALGRPPLRATNAPRPIDLDILACGDERIATPGLTLPHPRLTARRFVLQPLADILPALVLPGDRLTIAAHLGRLPANEPPLALAAAEW